ncbi:Tc5 transposase DNA-binding domain [Phytophthora infestans]|uniref:Tc5 transposase DNA-binding domain n=1 Tax=Phytophthora infestans TaxID=4787 RepID=A0A833S6V5_PHYIN|nr:Tc5 transposase DNA-binding domain [Phytophthora infestans]KAF4144247.1 Tc5 transposase DNA-binding domain [Phytophthora infestans]
MTGRPRVVRVKTDDATVEPPRPTQRREAVSYVRKLEIVVHYETHNSLDETVAFFFPDAPASQVRAKKQLVMRWKRERAKIAAICEAGGGRKTNDRKFGMGATLSTEAEQRIVDWMHAEQAADRPVSAKRLSERAMQAAQEDKLHPDSFKASWTWRQSFLRRHGFTQGAQRGHTIPDTETTETEMTGTTL